MSRVQDHKFWRCICLIAAWIISRSFIYSDILPWNICTIYIYICILSIKYSHKVRIHVTRNKHHHSSMYKTDSVQLHVCFCSSVSSPKPSVMHFILYLSVIPLQMHPSIYLYLYPVWIPFYLCIYWCFLFFLASPYVVFSSFILSSL